jgi:hypothetical protein
MKKTCWPLTLALVSALTGCSRNESAPEPQKFRAITQPANPEQQSESAEDFIKAKDMQVFNKVADIPAACKNAFDANELDENAPQLADPPADGDHAKWDGKLGPNGKRLILAGANPRTCFVYFREGGSLGIYELQIFHLIPNATVAYDGSDTQNVYTDVASLRRAIKAKTFERTSGIESFGK